MSPSWSLALGLSWLGFGCLYEAAARTTLRRIRLPPTTASQALRACGYGSLVASFVAFRAVNEAFGVALVVALSVWSLVFTLGTLLAPVSPSLFRASLLLSVVSACFGAVGSVRT